MDEAIQAKCWTRQIISAAAQVAELEEKLAAVCGSETLYYLRQWNGCVGTWPCMTWGIGEGDAVFVPDFTFFSSAETVAYEGATPVFVDVLEDTFNMDPDSLERGGRKQSSQKEN